MLAETMWTRNWPISRFGSGPLAVSAASSAYLFTHPDVNDFFTSLHGLPREEIKTRVMDYMNAHPQERDELTAIRQPLVDIKNRCGYAFADAGDPDMPE